MPVPPDKRIIAESRCPHSLANGVPKLRGPALVRCDQFCVPYLRRMKRDTRFEIRLPAANRRELLELAAETGLTSADLVRIGLRWVLTHREALFKTPMEHAR
jgi:hypothetical protein